jgi:lipoprotein NlpI
MFLAMFPEAVADYQKMSELDPASDASHWRLGIALFYASKPDKAAAQFDKYHSFDNVDRENGIWRYFSHYRAFGAEKAREQLLKYEKDDRPPFPEVYRLFEGNMTPEQVLAAIPDKLDAKERQPRLFYSNLYIGLNHVVEGHSEPARPVLLKAIQNDWPRSAGYGPDYMWHVGRLQYFELLKKKTARKTE